MKSLISIHLKRGIFVFVLAAYLGTANASAVELRPLPGGSSEELVVGNGGSYWVQGTAIMRTDLASGLTSLIATVPRRVEVSRMSAAAGQLLVSTFEDRSGKSTITRYDSAGAAKVVARSRFHRHARSNCGAFLRAGLISANGEITWERENIKKFRDRKKCKTLGWDFAKLTRTVWSLKSGATKPIRLMKSKSDSGFPVSGHQLDANGLVASNDGYLLYAVGDGEYLQVNRKTGDERSISAYHSFEEGPPGMLDNGTTLINTFVGDPLKTKFFYSAVPALRTFSGSKRLLRPLQPNAGLVAGLFCGSGIVEVESSAVLTEDELFQFAIDRFEINGSNPSKVATPAELPKLNVLSAACDGNTLVLRLSTRYTQDEAGKLSTYALNVP